MRRRPDAGISTAGLWTAHRHLRRRRYDEGRPGETDPLVAVHRRLGLRRGAARRRLDRKIVRHVVQFIKKFFINGRNCRAHFTLCFVYAAISRAEWSIRGLLASQCRSLWGTASSTLSVRRYAVGRASPRSRSIGILPEDSVLCKKRRISFLRFLFP